MSNIKIVFERENKRAAAYDGYRQAGECLLAFAGEKLWVIVHTEVDPAYGGRGIAGGLVKSVLEEAGRTGVKVRARCSYAAGYLERHPEYAGIWDRSVITVFGMATCPDCAEVKYQIRDDSGFRFVDIGEHVKNLKAFLRIRDVSPVFDDVKKNGRIGIPCFVLSDGTVTLRAGDLGLNTKTD